MSATGAARRKITRILDLAFLFILLLSLILVIIAFFPGFSNSSVAKDCEPNDQDRYVYRPGRLQVLSSCVRVTGVVRAVYLPNDDDDGDVGIQLELDPPFERYLNEASRKYQGGYMHVESVCYLMPNFNNLFAQIACTFDPDPYHGPFPSVGQRVWMEGRWVLDFGHEGWAELHPQYRWGPLEQ